MDITHYVYSLESAINSCLEAYNNIYGKWFASDHEYYAVLKEELEEAREELDKSFINLELLWTGVRENKIINVEVENENIEKYCRKCISELIQVLAICKKHKSKK